MVDLGQLVLDEKHAYPDPVGNTPLLRLAEDYRCGTASRNEINGQLIGLAGQLVSMPYHAVRHTVLFMELAAQDRAVSQPVLNAYKDVLRNGLNEKKDLHKRAEVIRFVAEYGAYSLRELQKEAQVKEAYPWHWIDALAKISPKHLVGELKKLESRRHFKNCVQLRIPLWKERFGKGNLPDYIKPYDP